MKQISVKLDAQAEKAMEMLIERNHCSISDIVNAAVIAFSFDVQPAIPVSNNWVRVVQGLKQIKGSTVAHWCFENGIKQHILRYVCRNADEGKSIRGFGNYKHKWRDKEDEREFKTHTAYIAHCLYRDLGIDLGG